MMPQAEYVSPDGALRLLVIAPGGDITIGFAGYTWHTHGDILPGADADSPEAAARRFVDDVLSGRSTIAVLSAGDVIRDVWVTDDPAKERSFCEPGETIAFRLWDGTKINA